MGVSCIRESGCCSAYSSLYSFFFLSNFQTLQIFVTLFSGTMRPRRLKLGIHVDSGWMYYIYRNQAAASYLSLYFFIFLSNFQTLQICITLFSGTVRPRRLNLMHTWTMGGCMVYTGIRLLLLIYPVYFFIFLSLQFSNIKIFRHTFLRNCEA